MNAVSTFDIILVLYTRLHFCSPVFRNLRLFPSSPSRRIWSARGLWVRLSRRSPDWYRSGALATALSRCMTAGRRRSLGQAFLSASWSWLSSWLAAIFHICRLLPPNANGLGFGQPLFSSSCWRDQMWQLGQCFWANYSFLRTERVSFYKFGASSFELFSDCQHSNAQQGKPKWLGLCNSDCRVWCNETFGARNSNKLCAWQN